MKYIDTHTHLYLPEFDNDRDEAVARALGSGVVKMLMPNIDAGSLTGCWLLRKIPGYLPFDDRASSDIG
jgi:Tat protein secretion system quality control protein TatD with DNase activity